MLPWLQPNAFPLYLAPMAGVTDVLFRALCKELGADVMVTEFVSAEGILQADDRTRHYTEFDEGQRPIGVQLFGADGGRMGEAARKIIDRKQPDFIDINFGCPVNKVVSKNGGSALLRNCSLLESVARGVADAVRPTGIPVTAKIRIGWDANHINAMEVVQRLEDSGIQAVTIHGRTRAQGYSGLADWEVIGQVAESTPLPIIGNGDITSGEDVEVRRAQTKVSGVMIGRAAMTNPWVFQEAKHFLTHGHQPPSASAEDRIAFMRRHCTLAVAHSTRGGEFEVVRSMRSRLMHYTRSLPSGKFLRQRFASIASISELDDIAADYFAYRAQRATETDSPEPSLTS